MAGPETGPKPYPGGPEIGMAIVAAIMKKKKDELKEDTEERNAAWEKILSKKEKNLCVNYANGAFLPA